MILRPHVGWKGARKVLSPTLIVRCLTWRATWNRATHVTCVGNEKRHMFRVRPQF